MLQKVHPSSRLFQVVKHFILSGKNSKRTVWNMALNNACLGPQLCNEKSYSLCDRHVYICDNFRERYNIPCRKYCSHSPWISVLSTKQFPNISRNTLTIQNSIIRTMAKKASKSKSKSKKPSIDPGMAEGIVDLAGTESKMENVLDKMNQDFATKIPARITSGFIDIIMVKTGSGKKVPIYEVALVKAKSDNFTIDIQDNFPNAGKVIAAAIAETGFNLIPQVRGDTVIVPIPMFSQDQRTAVGKIAKTIADQAKVELRKVRQKGMSDVRKNKEGQSKDLIRRIENTVQQLTDYYTEKTDSALDAKVNEILGSRLK